MRARRVERWRDKRNRGSEERAWVARLGGGVTPVVHRSDNHLPDAHHGVGAFINLLGQLPYRFSAGGGLEWERYSYDTTTGEGSLWGPPLLPAERLTYTRVLALLEWDWFERGLANPYLLAEAGFSWEDASRTSWQCSPKTMSGPVVGGGAGLDIAVTPWISIGLEYRITTQPLFVTTTCTAAYIPDEPLGPPHDFVPQRLALTLGVSD